MYYVDFGYERIKSGVKITNYFGSDNYIEIPRYIDNLPVTEVGNNAFYDCAGVTKFKIPNSVTKIGNYAFGGCSSLSEIYIPNSVSQIGDGAFWNCHSLTEINMPNSVTEIGDKSFSLCKNLKEINIPNSVTKIGCQAFWRCESLTEINIPNSVTEIDCQAFKNCTSLTRIKFPRSNKILSSLKIFLKKYAGIIKYYDDLKTEKEVSEKIFTDDCSSSKKIKVPRNKRKFPLLQNFLTEDLSNIESNKNPRIKNLIFLLNTLSKNSKINWNLTESKNYDKIDSKKNGLETPKANNYSEFMSQWTSIKDWKPQR